MYVLLKNFDINKQIPVCWDEHYTEIKKSDAKYKAMIVAIQSELWSTVLYTVPDEHMSEGVRGTGDIVKQMMLYHIFFT